MIAKFEILYLAILAILELLKNKKYIYNTIVEDRNKVLVLVPLSNKYPSNQILNSIKKTWGNDNVFETIFYTGGFNANKLNVNYLELNISNDFKDFGKKTLLCFEEIIRYKDFDYVFRTNTSSYLNKIAFFEFITKQPYRNYYAGKIENFPNINLNFGSGAGYVLSRDLVELVVDNNKLWNHDLNEDVALGKILYDLKVPLNPLERYDINSLKDLKNIDLDHYHYRFRIDKIGYPRILELIILKIINYKIQNKDKNIFFFNNLVIYVFMILLTISKFLNVLYFIKKNEKLNYWYKKYISEKKPPWER